MRPPTVFLIAVSAAAAVLCLARQGWTHDCVVTDWAIAPQSIIDTITHSLLLNPDRRIQMRQTPEQGTLFDYSDFGEAAEAKENITRKIDEAAEREKTSRSIFAQNAIKASEIEEDLRAVDEAIGEANNPAPVPKRGRRKRMAANDGPDLFGGEA